jgi:hypothetical protein
MGFEISWIWSSDTQDLPDWLREEYPRAYFTTVVTALRKVDLVLCEGKPPNWLNSWALTSLVVSTASSKCIKPASDWRVKIRHSARGGLTDREVTIRFHSRMHLPWIEPRVTPVLLSCVYSIASDTVDFGVMFAKPHSRLLKKQGVQAIGPGCYHGGRGLYPTETCHSPQFVLPSVFHHPSGWCRRHLTEEERWMLWDVPWNITRQVTKSASPVSVQVWKKLLPGRCLDSGLHHLLRGFGVMDEGGIAYLPRMGRMQEYLSEKSESPSEEENIGIVDEEEDSRRKREREERGALGDNRDLNDETLVLDASLKKLVISGTKRKISRAVLDASLEKLGISGIKPKISRAVNVVPLQTDSASPVHTESTVRLRQALETEAGTRKPSNPNEAEGNFKASRSDTREVYDDSKEEDSVPATRVDAKEEDNVKATKSDDAEVKVRNWNLRLARELGKPLTPKMASSMDVLRVSAKAQAPHDAKFFGLATQPGKLQALRNWHEPGGGSGKGCKPTGGRYGANLGVGEPRKGYLCGLVKELDQGPVQEHSGR